MNLKQLETFVQIVEKGSFGAAADALHTTQSTVSARVKELEHYFGVDLFDRSAHRAQLTAKGRELFDMSRQVVGALEHLRERISDRSSLTGTLRLGAVGVVSGTWLPALLRVLRVRHPALHLEVEVALSRTLIQKLRGAEVDLAIIAGRVDDEELHCESVGEETFAWMASPSLGVGTARLTPADVAAFPVIAFPAESVHHPTTKAWFKAGGVRFQPAITCNSMEVIARLVTQGHGVGLLPCDYYRTEVAMGSLEVLSVEPPIARVDFTLLSLAQRPTAFVSAVTDAVKAVRQERIAGNRTVA
jgi:DNA-binding transcriptional LysR family regulator